MAATRRTHRNRQTARGIAMSVVLALAGCAPLPGPGAPADDFALLAKKQRVYALVDQRQEVETLRRAALGFGYDPQTKADLPGLNLFMVAVDLPDGVSGQQAITALEQALPGSTVGVNHAYRLQTRDFESGSPSSVRHGTEVASVLADPSRMTDVTIFSANVIRASGPNAEVAGAAGPVQAIDWLA